MDRDRGVEFNSDGPPKSIDGEPLDQILGGLGFAVEQQIVAIIPDQEIEQALPLRRQKPSPNRKLAGHVIGDEALDELAHIIARETDDGAIGQGGRGHAP